MTRLLLFSIALCSLSACNTSTSSGEADAQARLELPPGFQEFYDTFHSDSLYQIRHIQWPLQGVKTSEQDTNVINGRYYHRPENWRMHRPIGTNSGFARRISPLGDDLVEEVFADEKGDFGMKRRFAKFDGEWYLIYYSGMKHIAR